MIRKLLDTAVFSFLLFSVVVAGPYAYSEFSTLTADPWAVWLSRFIIGLIGLVALSLFMITLEDFKEKK